MPQKPASAEIAEIQRVLASNVRRRRHALGLTVAAASERGGLHWRHWQKIEAEEINATLETLVRLADALEMQMDALFYSPESVIAAEQRAVRLVEEFVTSPAVRDTLVQLFVRWIR
jgi:transcriptional regulator with XRE-family HTH domain